MFTVDLLLHPPSQIVIVGDRDRIFFNMAARRYLPRTEILWVNPNFNLTEDSPLYSLLSGKEAIANKPTAYICRNFTCDLPITEAQEFEDALNSSVAAHSE
jgi:uncharacterized protein YyaL (SSP411 family)